MRLLQVLDASSRMRSQKRINDEKGQSLLKRKKTQIRLSATYLYLDATPILTMCQQDWSLRGQPYSELDYPLINLPREYRRIKKPGGDYVSDA